MEQHEIIVREKMLANDAFSKWLGITVNEVKPGYCKLSMKVRTEMLNGFGIAHGGITYSFADSALAFASNSGNVQSVSIETSISHTKRLQDGDMITAEARELVSSNKTGVYDVVIKNQHNETVALFKGTVYRTSKKWIE
ncbi:MAG TPA: hydroxyphenylacetyl-CoA thioesterase PaaI [Bacteroidia bacterium]